MSENPYVPKVRRDSISWWAEVWDTRRADCRVVDTPCFFEWTAKFGARRAARRMWRLERQGWFAKGSYRV